MILDYTKNQMILLIGGSSTTVPTYAMIGSGSGTAYSTQTELIAPTDRQAITTGSYTSAYKIKYIIDWNSVEMSGLQLREFGMCGSQTGLVGSMWSRTTIPAITFDGTNELRCEETLEVY